MQLEVLPKIDGVLVSAGEAVHSWDCAARHRNMCIL